MRATLMAPRETRWSWIFLIAVVAALAAMVAPPQADARTNYRDVFRNTVYPASTTDDTSGRNGCQVCHGQQNGTVNGYGLAVRAQLGGATSVNNATIEAAIRAAAVENADSDGQGDSNLTEITANSQPGWTAGANPVFDSGNGTSAGTQNPANIGVQEPLDPPAAVPNIAVNPTTLGFGVVDVGNSNTQTTTIQNTGTADLTVSALNLAGTTEFSLGTAPATPFTLAPGTSATVDVLYTPVDNGTDTGSLAIVSNDPDSPSVTVTLTGTGNVVVPNACNFNVAPTSLAFGNVDIGVTSTLSTTVTNNGTAACSVTASVTSATGEFTLASGSPVTVAPGASASVSVDYAPGDVGADTGNLNLSSNDANNPQNADVPLTGAGVQPPVNACNFSVAPTSLAFGGVTVGSSSTLSTTVTNNGTAACNVTATVTSATGEFTLASGSPVSVASGASASVSVAYAPGDVGADTGNLNLASDDGTNPQSVDVPLSGTGVDVVACTGITINNAEWRTQGNGSLRVSGTGVRDGRFFLSNAFDLNQEIANSNGNNGRFNFNVNGRNLNPVPCRVRVEQPDAGLCGEADVANAPADCAPLPPVFGPVARGDTYATAIGKTLTVQLSRVSGVLYNDFDTDAAGANIGNAGLTAQLISGPANAVSFSFSPDGSFNYTPNATLIDNSNDSFTYQAVDAEGNLSEVATVNIHVMSDQTDFKIMMNYELGMHCTGFEFSYCCVLPPYNSILAQVVRPQPGQGNIRSNADFARLLEGDPNNGLDGLGRETVVRDYEHNGTFQKYYLEYFHDAQPRREGNMPGTFNDQTSTLISDIEGNSMLYHNTPYDSALVDTTGSITGVPGKMVRAGDPGVPAYNGLSGPVVGDGDYTGPADNYANGWLNHFYIYPNADGNPNLEGENATGGSLEADKIRLGVNGMVEYPANVGAALQPMGPVSSTPVPFDNVLTFSADTGTVVYTQMKVLENLPVMLTSPRIWEALGLPLTPFEDSISFFAEGPGTGPGSVDEDSIRPYVAMKARLHQANCNAAGSCTQGPAVVGSNGQPVIGHGTAPIDIPNCERCHSVPAFQPDGTPNVNSPSFVRSGDGPVFGPTGLTLQAITELEINYWKSVYPSLTTGATDWYARLKGAAVNMLALHDVDVGTGFLDNYPTSGPGEPLVDILGLPASKQIPQNTRMGHESVICQKCHGDNVIAAVAPMGQDPAAFRPRPISEAIHRTHRNQSEGGVIVFNDGLGRDGGCQGCHPAHRSDGVMDNYPITTAGNNANAGGDNRLNQGGCFVGRDVHSNPLKDVDGAETPEHLNAVGEWLAENVFYNQAGEPGGDADNRGIWCTNCHSQLGQEIWRHEDCDDLINGVCENDVRGLGSLEAIETAVGLSPGQAVEMLDPRSDPANPLLPFPGYSEDFTHAIWRTDIPDANVATIEVGPGGPVGTTDADGDFSVNILSFCTTDDCVNTINANKGNESAWRYPEGGAVDGTAGFISTANTAVPVPFSAATDGRDHWLAAGEPHCADCHSAPYVEQSGNINPFPPFNYPAKASLMRYSRGHQDLGCQACHESIHGLYPVSAAIDTTTYAQAAALNHDGSHGPLKCGTCHQVNGQGIPDWHEDNNDGPFSFGATLDAAVTFAHTFTAEANPLDSLCQNCHGDERDEMGANDEDYLEHAMVGRTSRLMMDKAEIAQFGHILGTGSNQELNQLCSACHENELDEVECDGEWRRHLTQGRVSEVVWEEVSLDQTGTTCGW